MCWGDPKNDDSPCNEYVPNDQPFTYEFGARQTWEKRPDGNIYPTTFGPEGNLYESWFRYGFYAAFKLISDPNFKKSCANCERASHHVINRCEKTELCDLYEIDHTKAFDRKFYGDLCESCIKKCDKMGTGKWAGLIWHCDDFVGEDE